VRLYIAGINGMVGSAVARAANLQGFEVIGHPSAKMDFTDRNKTFTEMLNSRPDALVIAAAKVGGIGANSSQPVEFLSQNLQIQTNLIDAAHEAKIEKLLFLCSSCIYPKFAEQPIVESSLLTGPLEETNEAYAIAKIAGVKLINAYRTEFNKHWISAMPTNLYGQGDNFDLQTAHVLPALIHRIHLAKVNKDSRVEIWGDGTPLREFLHVDDLAKASLLLLEKYDHSAPINIGSGEEISISQLATLVSKLVGYDGSLDFNTSKPNGTPRKALDSSLIGALGWVPEINLSTGIASTYKWFLENKARG
jgi:GDP-L-fucose synthase